MAKPFILLATQRTGSTWVQEMLNSHPSVRVYSEMFLSYASGMPMWDPKDVEFVNTYLEARVRRPVRMSKQYWTVKYLQRVLGQRDVGAVGFKYMYNQIRPHPSVLAYAALKRVRIVHLIRRNLLDTIISSQLADVSGVYHVANDGRQPIPWAPETFTEMKLTLDPDWTLRELHRLSRERALIKLTLKAARVPTCEAIYEDLAQDRARFDQLLRFVGVDGSADQLKSGLQKLNTQPATKIVENIGELRSALHGSPYERFLG